MRARGQQSTQNFERARTYSAPSRPQNFSRPSGGGYSRPSGGGYSRPSGGGGAPRSSGGGGSRPSSGGGGGRRRG
jgi:hypothetical protein